MSLLSKSGFFIIFALLLLAPGCARFVIPDMPAQKSDPARFQLARLESRNEDIRPYTGIGTLRFISDQETWSFRGAWLGVPDQWRFRVESIGIAGQPSIRLICDADACHFIYPENGCYRKISTRERNLGRLAGIDMEVADLVVLLGGGIPLVPHDKAWIEEESTGPVMIMYRRFYGMVGKIYFTPDMSRVHTVELFGFRRLKYRAEIPSTSFVDGHVVPDLLLIENEAVAMELRVERRWFDVSYSPESFVPVLPENKSCN